MVIFLLLREKFFLWFFYSCFSCMAVQSLITVESLSSACVESLEFTDERFILLVP